MIYLDNNATTQPAPEVVDAMLPFLRERWGNPSSMHAFGGSVKKAVDRAREQVAALLNADPSEILFTSCGTESDNAAIFGLGLWFNILHIDQLPVFTTVDSYSLTAGIEGVYSSNDFGAYTSVDGFLFFAIHGEPYKRAFIFPRSFGLYFGPVFSYSLSSDYDSTSSDIIGIGGGLNIRFTENMNLKLGGDYYSNDSSVYAQFSINF